ncbi:UDP-glucose 4-epimerase [Apiospora arundinis]|uniref:UDP-glucose 4-epimerase n=1 Tax=Apiospora arundinis TaxID=335852 RepID=A0ABR2IWG3_9PEZI
MAVARGPALFQGRERHTKLTPLSLSDEPKDVDEERPDKYNSFRISLAELQRLRLRKLQCKLVKAVGEMRFRDNDPSNWEGGLKSYIEAIKDYDYMIERSKSARDPFLVTGERKVDDRVIRRILGTLLDTKELSVVSVPGPWEEDNQPIGGTRAANVAQSALAGLKNRLATAALGGAFLVGPMWLMVKRADPNTSLVSTTLFVVVFGLLMAAYLNKSTDVMSATAAYAVVLVVFVGLGAQAPSSTVGAT